MQIDTRNRIIRLHPHIGKSQTIEWAKTLAKLPEPTDYKEFRRYMGMFSFYRQHIPHNAHIVEN